MKRRLDHAPYIVRPGGRLNLNKLSTSSTGPFKDKQSGRDSLADDVSDLCEAQARLFASQKKRVDSFSVSGRGGKGWDDQACDVWHQSAGMHCSQFQGPKLTRAFAPLSLAAYSVSPTARNDAIFNRSYYEEVLVVRVHPEFLNDQFVPGDLRGANLWKRRVEDTNRFEERLGERGGDCHQILSARLARGTEISIHGTTE